MKIALYPGKPAVSKLLKNADDSVDAWTVQLGDEILVSSPAKDADAVEAALDDAGSPRSGEIHSVYRTNLHLVMQKGRVFQLEHPDADILFDRGRYLIVDMKRSDAREIGEIDAPCFRILPLNEDFTVYESRARPEKRPARDDGIAALVAAVDESRYARTLNRLVQPKTRHSLSAAFADIASQVAADLAALGLGVTTPEISVGAEGSSLNIIAVKKGSGHAPRRRVVIGAHLDSINAAGGPQAAAPGADDNASGAAGVLELAQILSGKSFVHDIAFVLFGGEEQGLFGSKELVAELTDDDRDRIICMLNMDMIGSLNTPAPTVLLEGAELSRPMIEDLATMAETYTDLAVQISLNPFGSDHIPFLDAGIPAVLTIEGADGANDAIHTERDTVDRLDTGFAAEILRMNLAFVTHLAELSEEATIQPPAGDPNCPGCTDPALREFLGHLDALIAQLDRLQSRGLLTVNDQWALLSMRRLRHALCEGRA